MPSIPLTNGGYTKVDPEYMYLNAFKWYRDYYGYAVANPHKEINLRMHRLIIKADDNIEVDHINRDKLDNRVSNLRLCTRAENNQNRGKFSNNKSGLKGAYPKRGKYQSTIRYNGKTIYLGTFKTAIEAHKAYIAKAKQLHGKFFYKNIIQQV